MSEIAIRADRLCKSYRLYDAPRYRLLDMLGLTRAAATGTREHRAVSDISFEIRRGEKVAIIGRNGAGKSTLLKLITKVIAPSSGQLDIRGETQALLSLGTGFHPEFTGRQNAAAYLASLGFSGPELERMVDEAIAFAELDEFADQPIKTYSTGMGMRLMFAAATMIRPDLLVIDEVLGVGDAYFQQKSFQHIREICTAKQTTLLLVTHDIYNAAQLCDRMMWIDRGRLLIDAAPEVVVRAYEDSIREQEERRLRAKALGLARPGDGSRRVLVDIQSASNQPPRAPLYLSRLSVLVGGVQVASAPLGENGFDADGGAVLVSEGSNWGEAGQWHGRLARPLRTYGSPFHKITAAFDLPLKPGDEDRLSVRIEGWCEDATGLSLRVHGEDFERSLGALPLPPGAWSDVTLTGEHEPPDVIVPAPGSAPEAVAEPTAAAIGLEEPPTPEGPEPATEAGDPAAASEPSAEVPEPERSAPPTSDAGPVPAIADPAEPVPVDGAAVEPAGAEADIEPVAAAIDAAPDAMDATAPDIRMISPSLNITGVYGTGDVDLLALRMFDGEGRERHLFQVGSAITFALDYRLKRPDLREKLHVVMAFKRDGVADVMRLFLDTMTFDAAARPQGTLKARFDRLPLGPGQYSITVLVAREGYFHEHQTVFFSMNPGVYRAHVGLGEMAVEGSSQLYGGTGAVVDATWSVD